MDSASRTPCSAFDALRRPAWCRSSPLFARRTARCSCGSAASSPAATRFGHTRSARRTAAATARLLPAPLLPAQRSPCVIPASHTQDCRSAHFRHEIAPPARLVRADCYCSTWPARAPSPECDQSAASASRCPPPASACWHPTGALLSATWCARAQSAAFRTPP